MPDELDAPDYRPPDAPARDALGESDAFLDFRERLSRVAPLERPVLLVGERGTGKELAARRMHFLSRRWEGPLVALDCAALPPTLIESELFGYEPGAFTGARERRRGRFELASGGTLFLDELGNIPPEAQEKILRVVEYGAFERVGGRETVEVDVRILGATNADLPALARAGRFKPDLLDRLSFEVLHLPPLRARGGDIPLLAHHFAARMAHELGREEVPTFTDRALEALERHPWPGNVRELKNVVERSLYRAGASVIDRLVLDPFVSPYESAPPPTERNAPATAEADAAPASAPNTEEAAPAGREPPGPSGPSALAAPVDLEEAVAALEVRLLREALQAEKHNQTRAARRLGLTYHQFRGRLRKYSL
jgi:psp operon transcriptional activator